VPHPLLRRKGGRPEKVFLPSVAREQNALFIFKLLPVSAVHGVHPKFRSLVLQLKIGQATEVVTVTAEAPALNLVDADYFVKTTESNTGQRPTARAKYKDTSTASIGAQGNEI